MARNNGIKNAAQPTEIPQDLTPSLPVPEPAPEPTSESAPEEPVSFVEPPSAVFDPPTALSPTATATPLLDPAPVENSGPVTAAEEPQPAPLIPPKLNSEADQSVPMQMEASLAEAGRTLLHHQLEKLHKAENVAREGTDPEGIHDMRVATRRLRAALKVLEETVLDPKVCERYRRQLRDLAQALGDTRDCDVFLEHLENYRRQLSEADQPGLDPLRQVLTQRRQRSRKVMLKTLDNPKTHKLLRKLEQFTSTPGTGLRKPPADKNEVAPRLVRHFVVSTVWRSYEEVLAYETAIGPETPVAVLHRLRVASKRLRYTLEFFQEALPPAVKNLHKQLVDIQDDLGAVHDHQVAIQLCEHLLRDYPEATALRNYQQSRQEELDRLRRTFTPRWQALVGSAYKSKLAAVTLGRNSL